MSETESDFDNEVSFSDRGLNKATQALECPSCGEDWLHQKRVEVFNRHSEDDDRGQAVRVDYAEGETTVHENTASSAGNPSRRRDAIVIAFDCEQCHPPDSDGVFELVIKQHKGNEHVHWRNSD